MASLQIPIHSYQLRSKPASTSRLVNCFPEPMPPDASYPVILSRAPGITSWSTVGSGSIQAIHSALGAIYVVSGSELYKVDSNKTATLLGNIGAPNNIDMDSNTAGVFVVNEPNGYSYDGTTFAQITDTDFTSRGAGDVEFVDNFLLFREPDSGRFFGADLGSLTAFDALNFATAEGSPDVSNGMKADHRQLIITASKSTEIWQNTGVSGFPFERAINGYIEQGCLNGKTLQKIDQSVMWLADDYTVRRLDGITPVRVSTHAIEQKLFDITVSAASAFTYAQDGHLFYVLTSPEGTYIYDATTGQWHERQTYGKSFWNISAHAQAFGLELVGDSQSNKIGYMDPVAYDEFGDIQRMEWTYQPVYAEGRRAFHKRLEIVVETGVGLTLGQGSDPEVMMDYSDDGGITWKSLPNRSLGKIGEYKDRVFWSGLGSSRERVYRGAVSDPVRMTIVDTQLEVEGGRL